MSDPTPLILIVEDELQVRRLLRAALTAQGYRCCEAGTARDGLIQATTQPPDLILLDLGLPDQDGIQFAQQVRAWSNVPILVLSARGQETDKVSALDAGADDYLTKPFGIGELTARVRVALRHAAQAASPGGTTRYEASADGRTLFIDVEARSVRLTDERGSSDVRLTPTEFKFLALLVRHAGKVLTHQQILREVWGPSHVRDVQYLRVYAGEIRKKLEADPARPRFLMTEAGVGYRFRAAG